MRRALALAASALTLGLLLAVSTIYPTTFGSVVQVGVSPDGGTLPAASLVPGGIGYAGSEKAHMLSNGVLWAGPPLVASWTAISNFDAVAASEDVNFLGPLVLRASRTYYFADIGCSWDFAGTVGGGTGVVAEVYDVTASASVCSCTLGACATAALTPLTCACNVNYAPGALSTLALRITSGTDCTLNPQRIACTLSIQSGP